MRLNPAYAVGCVLACSVFAAGAHAHTLDTMAGYRLEIGWKDAPPYTGELNAIVLYVSPMVPGLELKDQPFQDGVPGLDDTLKMQLVSSRTKMMLRLDADPDVPGKYYAYARITKAGYYQANVVGTVENSTINISMHPPQVRNADHVEFPPVADAAQEGSREYDALRGELANLTLSLGAELDEIRRGAEVREPPPDLTLPYAASVAGMALGAAALGVAVSARRRS